jgi:hypothetical protein
MENKGAIALSTSTAIIIILSVVALGSGMLLVNNILTITNIPQFQSGMPPFFQASVYPENGQIGTEFRINLELTNKSGIYRIDSRIMNFGRIIKTIPLYDDGSHGDSNPDDGIYANTWNSEGMEEGIYSVDIIANPSENQAVYANATTIKIFRQNCEPLIYNGNPSDKIDIAIVPYGYSDLKQFRQDALQWITQGLMTYEPFASNINKFNFYIVNQQNDFSCNRDESTRTLMYCEDSKVEKQASQCPADQIIVILNDAEFCGTASSYARACNGWNLRQVLTHEFGHTFGGLGDEYSYASAYPAYQAIASTYPNCDIEGCTKWASIGSGCFKGCGVDSLYRPTKDNCLMKKYTDIFCPVCRDHITSLLNNYQPGTPQLLAAPPAEKTYLIDLDYDKGNLTFKNAYVTKSIAPDRKITKKSDYTGRLVSFDGREIYSFDFELPNVLFFPPPQNENEPGPPPIILDKVDWTILAPQSDNASKLDIYDKNKKILSIDLGYLSNSCGDGKCEAHESAVECAQDCKPDIKDNLCNYAKDGVCDPDCSQVDPDCRSINILLIVLIGISIASIAIIIIASQIKND